MITYLNKRKDMFTLRNKVILSSVLAAFLLNGCETGTSEKDLTSHTELYASYSSMVPTVAIDNRNAYNDQQDNEDLSPDFIDPYEINQAVKDQGCKTYEDAEDGSTDGWVVFDQDPSGAFVSNSVTDGSHVIALHGDGIKNGFYLRRNNGDFWNNQDADMVEWSGKFSDDFIIFVSVLLDNGAVKYLSYSPSSHGQVNDVFPFMLPQNASDGNWHTYTRNLQDDIKHYLPEREIKSVLDFQIRGDGYLDDIQLLKSQGCDSDSAIDSDDDCQSGCSNNTTLELRYKVSKIGRAHV